MVLRAAAAARTAGTGWREAIWAKVSSSFRAASTGSKCSGSRRGVDELAQRGFLESFHERRQRRACEQQLPEHDPGRAAHPEVARCSTQSAASRLNAAGHLPAQRRLRLPS